MKVLFQTRVDLFDIRGGDTVQVEKTAEGLRRLGVDVEINPDWKKDLKNVDIVHIFQLDWMCEPYLQAFNAKKQNKKLVLSPIHHSEKEVLDFEKYARYNYRRIANIFLRSQEARDVLKNIYRSFFDPRKGYATFLSIRDGYRNQQRQVLKMSDMVLTQTEKEALDIRRDFGVEIVHKKIALGVGEVFRDADSLTETFVDIKDYIVVGGRIEPRKNQLNIIEAVSLLRQETKRDLKLLVVGDMNKNNWEYYLRFKTKVKQNPWILYFPAVPYEKMPLVYKAAKVCVSASWFETTGLTALEAAFCGCNVVVRDGDTGERMQEYLGNLPYYCNPLDISSIKDAIWGAYQAERPSMDENLKKIYTWDNVAKETLSVYNSLLTR